MSVVDRKAELRARLLAEKGLQRKTGAGPIAPRGHAGPVPLSYAQRRLWFVQQMDAANPAYNMPGVVRIAGRLDATALEAALRTIIQRHEALRTTFRLEGDEPVQVVTPAAEIGFVVERAEAGSTREFEALADAEALRPFDLERGPLLRAKLVRTGAAEWHLLLTLHHIVFDGWSLGVFARELAAAYAAAPLPPLAVQYPDFAAHQRSPAHEARLATHQAYWERQLAGLPRLELPTDRPRPAQQAWAGSTVFFELPAKLGSALAALGQSEGASLFMTLLAAFDVLLLRLTRQEDIVVGSPIAGRTTRELEPLVGFFVNSLVLRTDVSGNPTFRELLARVKRMTLAAYEHQDLPFERLVDALGAERDLSRHPLFQVVFALQNASMSLPTLPGAELTLVPRPARTAKFDLIVSLEETPAGLKGWVEFSTALFDAATIERMLGHYRTLLESIVAAPDTRVRALRMLPAAERAALVAQGVGRVISDAPESPAAGLIHERFESCVQRWPEKIALTFEGASLTYAELNRRANALARELRRRGVGPDAIVALAAERSFEMVVGILGILKAGGAYLPLDPAYPADRLAYMLEDSGARVLVGPLALTERFPVPGIERLAWESSAVLQPAFEDIPTRAEAPRYLTPAHAAYVIYTSGSTGRPKGVVVTHANVTRLMTSTEPWFGFNADDVWTLYHSFAFDFSVWELWGPLLCGGRLVIVPYLTTRNYEAFHRLLADEGVTVLNQTPSAFRQVIKADEAAPGTALRLRQVIFGGEALELQSLRGWIERRGDERPQLVNMYGITETTVHVTYRRIRRADVERGAGSVIGVPIPDLQLHVLEDSLEPAPVGVAGELHVGGAGLARGYLGRPELTATRFVADPFSAGKDARLYRSGDLARRLSDGDIEYLGRIDDQVKIRGFRIELGEIESVLASHAAVREAVVIVSGRENGEPRLVAYMVFRAGAAPTITALREHLRRDLPDYMVPAAFVVLEALPLTGNGKVDRRALPEPEATRPELESAFAAPSTPAEVTLARIWAEALGLERVGVHDNFFALGGDSILSIRILAQARKAGLEFSLQQLFQSQTIAGLAQIAATGVPKAEAPDVPAPFALVPEEDRARLPAGLDDAYPLAALQAGMLFHGDFDRASAVFHDVFTQRVRMPFDAAKFERCLAGAIARHPVLRTAFALEEFSRPLQLVHAAVPTPLVVADWRDAAPVEQAARLRTLIETRKHARFDWRRPPFFSVHLHRLGADTAQFTIDFHHAILDGWSFATLVSEVFAEYLVSSAVLQPALGKAETRAEAPRYQGAGAADSFRRFIALETAAQADDSSRQFWRGQVAESEFLRLPRTTQPAGAARTIHSALAEIPADVSEGLKRFAAESGVPVKTVLLAAHVRVLSVLGGQRDVLTGLTVNGRPEVEGAERALGLFLNTVPFRLRVGEGTFAELVRAVFAAEQAASAHRRFPLADIQKGHGRAALFETSFNFVHFHVYQDVLGRDDFAPLGGEFYEETNFALMSHFSLDVFSGRVVLELKADGGQFSPAEVREFAGYYERALTAMARTPAAPVLTTSLLPAAVRRTLLVDWNATTREIPGECVHRRIELQVAHAPDAPALALGAARLTYGELNARANQLAHLLRARGAGRGSFVGVCLERSFEMVVALLAVMKSGAAYVPLDPHYPAERLGTMVADCGARLVVTASTAFNLFGEMRVGAAGEAAVVDFEADAAAIAAQPEENPAVDVTFDDLVYAIYTSGSTGRPKAAAVYHRGFANLVAWHATEFPVGADEATLLMGSFNFDMTHKNFYAPLIQGGTLHLLPPGPYDPDIIAGLIARERIALLNCTPSAFYPLLERSGGAANWADLSSLRWVALGGEPTALARVAPWLRSAACRATLANTYGPTEASDISVFHVVTRDDLGRDATAPTGRPIPNAALLIADESLQPCPPGVAGELCIAGAGVGAGYVGDSDRTAKRFVVNPHPELPGTRLYRTGDRARYRADGVVEYLGRFDHQVKVRGFRIELGEIESALGALPAVRQAIAVTLADERGDRRIVAYVQFQSGQAASFAEMRAALAQRLPDYMIPAQFVTVGAWPMTATGKVDRRALPAPDAGDATVAAGFVEPRTENERVLARIWAEVLRRERVGATEGFFELGGDSILSIQIVSKARAAGLELSARDVFEHPTLAELAAVARSATRASTAPAMSPLGRYAVGPMQQWFFDRAFAQPAHWNQGVLLAARGPVDVRALEAAVHALVAHHDGLRTRFTREAGGWMGEVLATVVAAKDAPLFVAVDGAQRAEAELAELADALQASLEPAEGRLVRAAWIDFGNGEGGRFLMVVHHLVVDGVSWRVLAEDLLSAYEQARGGRSIALPAKSGAYRAWAEGLKDPAAQAMSTEEEAYWRRLATRTVAPLPADLSGGEEADTEANEATIGRTLEVAETTMLLRDFPAAQRTQTDEVLLTALARAMAAWTGRAELWLEVESHGREDVIAGLDLGRTVGWFTALAPVWLDLTGARDAAEAMKAVKEQWRAVPRHGIGFGLACRHGRGALAEALRAVPRPEFVFNYLGQFDQALPADAPFGVATEAAGRMRGAANRRTHALQVTARVVSGRLHVEWSYGTKRHAAATIAALADAFVAEVRALLAAGGGAALTPSDFQLMGFRPDELDDLVADAKGAEE